MTPLVLDTSVIFKWSRQPHEEPLVPQALVLLDQYLHGETEIRVPTKLRARPFVRFLGDVNLPA